MSSLSDMSAAFKTALVTAATTAINDTQVMVCYGHPGFPILKDVVSVGRIMVDQEPGPLSAGDYVRDLTLSADVTAWAFRKGEQRQEQVAGDRALGLISALEDYVRRVDPTVGGTVQWCFCTHHESVGVTDPEFLTAGRLIEVVATFTAYGRIQG